MPIQQMLLGAGASAEKTYIDNIFSTDLWLGTASNKTITNGINLSEDGGMVWIKNRPRTYQFLIQDTVGTGTSKSISTNSAGAQQSHGSSRINQFNTNGFRVGNDTSMNESNKEIVSWTFKKTPKFFDCIKYTGNETARTISHNLESVPGMIVIKSLTQGGNWRAYHRGVNKGVNPENYYLRFNSSSGKRNDTSMWQDTAPTATSFSIQADDNPDEAFYINKDGEEYIAYLFAGGDSTAATAHSCSFNGSSSDLQQSSSSDLAFGTGDYTVECWVKPNSLSSTLETLFDSGGNSGNSDTFYFGYSQSQVHVGTWSFYVNQASTTMVNGQWTHIAACRSGSTMRIFKNGILIKSVTDNTNWASNANITIGRNRTGAQWVNGSISNLRVIKGTALYTSSFKPPTEPLTNVTNTVLLTLNNSSATGATVSPGTWTNSNVTASSDSPFDDPAGFAFGESGSENVVKCGSYVGNGNADGPDVYVGFEPQWLLIKRTSSTEDWIMFDSMRTSNRSDMHLDDMRHDSARAEGDGAGGDSNSYLNWTPTGFKLKSNTTHTNNSGDNYIFCAIRRPDGYVGKPVELGTSVFNMVYGSGTNPTFAPGFPVDFTTLRRPGTTENWTTAARLMPSEYLYTNDTDAETFDSAITFDYNNGFHDTSGLSTYLSWSWQRHAGFDVVEYKGGGASSAPRSFPHSLGKAPEMIWTKNRDSSVDWVVWHKGLNGGGNNAVSYNLRLNQDSNQSSNGDIYGGADSQLPTSTHWTTGGNNMINENGSDFIALLFASVDGISSVGSYSGSSSSVSVTTGFQPRFVIIKRNNNQGQWAVFDTVRGINSSGSGGDYLLYLNQTLASTSGNGMIGTWIDLSSTGFTVSTGWVGVNGAESEYIYYAHA